MWKCDAFHPDDDDDVIRSRSSSIKADVFNFDVGMRAAAAALF